MLVPVKNVLFNIRDLEYYQGNWKHNIYYNKDFDTVVSCTLKNNIKFDINTASVDDIHIIKELLTQLRSATDEEIKEILLDKHESELYFPKNYDPRDISFAQEEWTYYPYYRAYSMSNVSLRTHSGSRFKIPTKNPKSSRKVMQNIALINSFDESEYTERIQTLELKNKNL